MTKIMPTSEAASFSAGSVVVVKFPYSDRVAEKRRPAVSGAAVAQAGYVRIAMITSARNAGMSGDIPIRDFAAAGLGAASTVRPLKIACIEPGRILRRIGALPPATAAAVFAAIHDLVGPT